MSKLLSALLPVLFALALPATAVAAEDPADVAAVVAAVKAANPDLKALCKKGPDAMKQALTDAVKPMYKAGTLKGKPRPVATAAAEKIKADCAA